jgi:adenylate kinase
VSQLNLVLLGPPGAGKGTQAQKLSEDFSLAYIATGDMLREAVKNGSELGKAAREYMERGDLVPDELICKLIIEQLEQGNTESGFILDGFPRTEPQAEALDRELQQLGRSLTAALLFDVDEAEVMTRLSGRRMCVKNGHNYHVEYNKPKHEGRCDLDGSRLVQRDDDREDVVRHRLQEYRSKTEPLIGYYENQGVLRRVDGSRSADEVRDQIRATLAAARYEEEDGDAKAGFG